jgi:hypothetical protein
MKVAKIIRYGGHYRATINVEFLFLLRNLWSHLAWFTWLKIMTPTKNAINDNDIFFIVMIDMYSKCHSKMKKNRLLQTFFYDFLKIQVTNWVREILVTCENQLSIIYWFLLRYTVIIYKFGQNHKYDWLVEYFS